MFFAIGKFNYSLNFQSELFIVHQSAHGGNSDDEVQVDLFLVETKQRRYLNFVKSERSVYN